MDNNLNSEDKKEPNNFSERGFAQYEPTETSYGAFVSVYESSSAMEPKLWLKIEQPEPEYPGQLEAAEAYAHMTLEQAKEIHNKLGTAIDFMEESERVFLEEFEDKEQI